MPGWERGRVVGLSVAPDGVRSVVRERGRLSSWRFASVDVLGDAEPGLAAALGDLLEGLGPPSVSRLHISLAPSLAPGRMAASGDARAGAAVRGLGPPSSAGDSVTASGPPSSEGDRYVAHCPAVVLDRLVRALGERGASAEAVTTSDHAWAEATAREAAGARPSLCVVQLEGPQPEIRVIGVSGGRPAALRRLPPGGGATLVGPVLRDLADRLGGRGLEVPFVVLGDASFREAVHAVAAAVSLPVCGPGGLLAELDYHPGFVAAAFAGAGPGFVPPEVVAAAALRRRRWTAGAVAASAALLAASGMLRTADLARELAAVRAARSGIQAEVAAALHASNEAEALSDALAALRTAMGESPRWSSLIGDLSEGLPPGTYTTALRTAADTLFVDMEGDDAARAFEGLRGMPGLAGFRAAAPVRRDVDEGSRVVERFTAAATVSWPRAAHARGGPP